MPEQFYLTTPLYYVNAKPHIGHSYTNIAADALARYHRLTGKKVLFLTGTDEHGQKIKKAAEEAGMEPKAYVDKISETFRDLWKKLHISYDDFIRTTEDRHIQAVQSVWTSLSDREEIYKTVYAGYYCVPDESFFTDRQVLNEDGKLLCPDCGRPVERLEEDNYFLKLTAHQGWLIEAIKSGEVKVLPNSRKNEVLGFLENNILQDLCISRPAARMPWGIPSPLDPKYVTYVWFDALINYISACGYGANIENFEKWWLADVHIIGKDILRHHAVYWPIILRTLGLKSPKLVFAHGWWVQDGEKMSKSRGNAVDPLSLIGKYGIDPYRFFLLSETPFGDDGTFSEEKLVDRYNHALANDLGNLLHRSLTMCEKYFAGEVPVVSFETPSIPKDSPIYAASVEIQTLCRELPDRVKAAMSVLAFGQAMDEIWKIISLANKFIEVSSPWTLAKQNKTEEPKFSITTLMETLKIVGVYSAPFIPLTAEALWKQLGVHESIANTTLSAQKWGYFSKGGKVAKGDPLFPRIDTKKD